MTHAESAESNNVIDITNRLPLDPNDPYALVESIHLEREARRLQLAEQGWTPDRVRYLLGREFGPRIARLALKVDVSSLLEPATEHVRPSSMTEWAQREYAANGSDDVRSRQLPRGDRD